MNLTVHPAAEAFRMMSDDELAELAADIKVNGLIHPIMLDSAGKILVDGRNRFKACELAGVEPRFERLNGIDPRAYIIASNIARRNITKGQAALAVALIYPEPEKGGRGKRSENSKETLGFSTMRLSQARQIVRHADLVDRVRSGAMPFDTALTEARTRENTANSDETRLANLRADAPDLADLIDEGRLTLTGAEGELAARRAQIEDVKKAGRRASASLLDFCADVVSIYSAHDLGERGLVTIEHLTKLDEAMRLLRQILANEKDEDK